LKNHSKKHSRDVVVSREKKSGTREKDVLEQIEEGCLEVLAGESIGESMPLPPMRLAHPDSLRQPQQNASWRPPSPPGPPPARINNLPRTNRTEGRSPADDQYIHKLEKEIASLRAQNHAQVKDINDLRVQIYTQQQQADTAASVVASASASALASASASALKTRSGTTYNTEPEEQAGAVQVLDANNEFSAKAVPKPRKRAAPKAASASSGDFRLATF